MLSIADIETAFIAFLDEIPQETGGLLSGFDVTEETAKQLFEGFVRYLKN
jgi:hypothetical protein